MILNKKGTSIKVPFFVILAKINPMVELVKDYASKRLDLLKMEATEKSSLTAGALTFLVMTSVAAIFFIILLNIGLGLWIGSLLGNYAYGILIMAGFYFLMLLIIILARNSIKNSIANKIIKALNQ